MFPISPQRRWPPIALLFVVLAAAWPLASAAPPPQGRGAMRGMMGDAGHQADMQLIQSLFENRERITRHVTVR